MLEKIGRFLDEISPFGIITLGFILAIIPGYLFPGEWFEPSELLNVVASWWPLLLFVFLFVPLNFFRSSIVRKVREKILVFYFLAAGIIIGIQILFESYSFCQRPTSKCDKEDLLFDAAFLTAYLGGGLISSLLINVLPSFFDILQKALLSLVLPLVSLLLIWNFSGSSLVILITSFLIYVPSIILAVALFLIRKKVNSNRTSLVKREANARLKE